MGKPLRELRKLKKVAIPEGVERIDNYLFWGSTIQGVAILVNVREIGIEAFCNCSSLTKLLFRKAPTKNALAPPAPQFSSSQLKVISTVAFC